MPAATQNPLDLYRKERLGSFKVTSGKLWVADPRCGRPGCPWSLTVRATNGTWAAFAYWDDRYGPPQALQAVLRGVGTYLRGEYRRQQMVEVDTGSLGIVDSSLGVPPDEDALFFHDDLNESDDGLLPYGVFASTSCDGPYPADVKYQDRRAVEVLLPFFENSMFNAANRVRAKWAADNAAKAAAEGCADAVAPTRRGARG